MKNLAYQRSVNKTIKQEVKEEKNKLLSMLIGILGASLLGNILIGKSTTRAGEDRIRAIQYL